MSDRPPGDLSEDEAALARYGQALAEGIERALPGWVVANVERLLVAWFGVADPAVVEHAEAAGSAASAEVGPQVRALLDQDVDQQRTTPLALVRGAVHHPTAVLADAGVPPVQRDALAVKQHPDDVYDLTPATFADLDPALHEAGLAWGAAKAHVHLKRHGRGAGGGS